MNNGFDWNEFEAMAMVGIKERDIAEKMGLSHMDLKRRVMGRYGKLFEQMDFTKRGENVPKMMTVSEYLDKKFKKGGANESN